MILYSNKILGMVASIHSLSQSVCRSCNAKPMDFAMVWTLPEVDPPRKEHLFFESRPYVNVRLKRPENDLMDTLH